MWQKNLINSKSRSSSSDLVLRSGWGGGVGGCLLQDGFEGADGLMVRATCLDERGDEELVCCGCCGWCWFWLWLWSTVSKPSHCPSIAIIWWSVRETEAAGEERGREGRRVDRKKASSLRHE